MGEIVVQKYGGSSLATTEKIKKVAKYVKETARSKKVIVVVSAMGDETDRLKELAQEISGGKPSISELDKLLATGEEQSAPLLAMAIQALGQEAVSLTGFQIRLETAPTYGGAKIRGIRNVERIKKLLDQGRVVVVAGFQGIIKGSDEIATLGQGGSDLTAVALAGVLKTNYCQIYTDVDGVYTIDPRIVPRAKRFENSTYSQMLQLSGAGAGVLMDRCIMLAQNLGVKIRVLLSPSFGKSSGGTLVYSGSSLQDMEGATWSQPGVAVQKEMALVKLYDVPNLPGMASQIFQVLSDINLVDIVQGRGDQTASISILCFPNDLPLVLENLKKVKEIKIAGSCQVVGLTLVDLTIKEQPGCLYRVCQSVAKAGVNIEMLSSSGITILMVVKKEDLKKAANALGKEFDLLTR